MDKQRSRISIGIVTHNNEGCILELLHSIKKFTKNIEYRLLVVDNSSIDKTVELINSVNDYDIELIENKKNIGFGAAHNMIIGRIDSEYHVIVNPDITLKENTILNIYNYLENNHDIGLLTPKILNSNGTMQLLPKRKPKFIYLLSRRLSFNFLDKYRHEYEMRDKDLERRHDIEFSSGCFIFIRTNLLKQVGGFDERYFLYFEDADLTRKILKNNRVEYNPNFTVTHSWDRAGQREFKYFLIQIVSMFKYFIKWNIRG